MNLQKVLSFNERYTILSTYHLYNIIITTVIITIGYDRY